MLRTLIFFTIVFSMIGGNVGWWRCAWRSAGGAALRWIVTVWALAMLLGMASLVLGRLPWMRWFEWPWQFLVPVYVWHLLFVLPWLAWRLVRAIGLFAWRFVGSDNVPRGTLPPDESEADTLVISSVSAASFPIPPAEAGATSVSRRAFITAAVLTPPVLTSLVAWRAIDTIHDFRIRRFDLLIPNLPPALAGLTIAHLADSHLGKFTDERTLNAVVDATNKLKPDLVAFTGDLIDWDLRELPGGVAALRRLDPRFGTCLCEGNHDLFQSRTGFERAILAGDFPMPINETVRLMVRGVDVQFLGLRWGGPDRSNESLENSEQDMARSVAAVMEKRRPEAFGILLAHHPHAFDYLGDADVPLILAGHTHGGQLNLGPIHPGSLRFRYLSGRYEKAGRQLIVTNGVGNWFPLRVNAPAEIVHLTLHAS